MSMTFQDRHQRVQDLIQSTMQLRRAAELIKHAGYCPHSGEEVLPEGHSIWSALRAVAADDHEADALVCQVAGFLLMTARPGAEITTRPMNGDVANVVSFWEGRVLGPTLNEAVALLSAAANSIDAYASVISVSRPSS